MGRGGDSNSRFLKDLDCEQLVVVTAQTTIPVKKITKELVKMGYEVVESEDAGRFVCNFVYYHSLVLAEQNGTKSIFVHVPPFSAIDQHTQMHFAASLLEVLAFLA